MKKILILLTFLFLANASAQINIEKSNGTVYGGYTTEFLNGLTYKPAGLLVHNSTIKTLWFWDGSEFVDLLAGTSLSDPEVKLSYERNANTNAFTDAEKSKLSGVSAGAEVNVQSDWNAGSGDAQILNKPTIPPAATYSNIEGDPDDNPALHDALELKANDSEVVKTFPDSPTQNISAWMGTKAQYHSDPPSSGIVIITDSIPPWSGGGGGGESGLILGEISTTAYRGDRGKIAFDHVSETSNPHLVTKAQVGLGNVDNTTDLGKPISTLTQTALNAKQNTLVSGTSIRTVNGNSLLGPGNIAIEVTGGGDMLKSDNLSGLANTTTARSNLGLGSLAPLNAIASTNITDGTIMNVDINASAGIAASKIADGTVNNEEFQRINSLTSNAQDQLNSKANLSGATFTGAINVPDQAYGSGWNSSTQAPTKNAVYDKIETIVPNATHTGDVTGSTALTIANNAVTTAKIANDALENRHITNNAISGDKLTTGTLWGTKLVNNSIQSAKLETSNSPTVGDVLTFEGGAENIMKWEPLSVTQEGGAFTPSVSGTGSGSYTFSGTSKARYLRVGNVVHYTIRIVALNGTASGSIRVTGFPISPSSESGEQKYAVTVGRYKGMGSNHYNLTAEMTASSSFIAVLFYYKSSLDLDSDASVSAFSATGNTDFVISGSYFLN